MNFIIPQNATVVSAYVGLISLTLTGLTFVLAILIFREAKKIREIEWISTTNAAWNDFNKLILTDTNHKEWMEFLTTETAEYDQYDPAKRINWILYCYLNILVSSMHAEKSRHRSKTFYGDILNAEIKVLKKRRDYILRFMEINGYDKDFITLYRRSSQIAA